MARVGRPVVVGVLVVLLAAASVVAYQRVTHDPLALGDRGAVTAVVSPTCRDLNVEVDGLSLSTPFDADDPPELPEDWRGRSIDGELTLDRRSGDASVEGTFTADDGTVVPVSGGVEGEVFFQAACTTWG